MRTSRARFSLASVLRRCLAIPMLAAATAPAPAATINVNTLNQVDVGQCTIATAIASVNAGADQAGCTHSGTYGTGDTIVLASSTYNLALANNGNNAFPIIQKLVTINGN